MPDPDTTQRAGFVDAFVRPVWIVMVVAQMVLGLALLITLIVKYYMLVVGTQACLVDGITLSNLIVCTTTPDIMAHFIFALAGFRLAALLFVDQPRAILKPVMIAVAGIFLLFLSGLTRDAASWPVAATLVALLTCLSVLYIAQFGVPSVRPKDDTPQKKDAW